MSTLSTNLVKGCWYHALHVFNNYYHTITSLSTLKSTLALFLQQPDHILEYYKATDPLETGLYFCTFLTVLLYTLGEVTRNFGHVDRSWSISPIIYAWHFAIHDYLLKGSFHPRLVAGSILITVWGCRLTYNYARKGGYYFSAQDYRFVYLEKQVGQLLMSLLNLTFIAPIQNIILFLIVTPLWVTNYLPRSTDPSILSIMDIAGILSFLTFFLIEAVADEQQFYFQTEKHGALKYLPRDQLKGDHKLGFLRSTGLFQYSRHPNFLGEQGMWWATYLFSIAAVQEVSGVYDYTTLYNWTISGAFILTLLFQASTQLTEKISIEKYPEYKEYTKEVSKLLLWFPSKTSVSRDKKEL